MSTKELTTERKDEIITNLVNELSDLEDSGCFECSLNEAMDEIELRTYGFIGD